MNRRRRRPERTKIKRGTNQPASYTLHYRQSMPLAVATPCIADVNYNSIGRWRGGLVFISPAVIANRLKSLHTNRLSSSSTQIFLINHQCITNYHYNITNCKHAEALIHISYFFVLCNIKFP